MGVWRDYSCVCRTLVPTSIFIGSRDQGVLIAKVKVVWSQGGRDQSTGVVGQPLDLPSLIISGWDAFLQMVWPYLRFFWSKQPHLEVGQPRGSTAALWCLAPQPSLGSWPTTHRPWGVGFGHCAWGWITYVDPWIHVSFMWLFLHHLIKLTC